MLDIELNKRSTIKMLVHELCHLFTYSFTSLGVHIHLRLDQIIAIKHLLIREGEGAGAMEYCLVKSVGSFYA